MFEPLSPCGGPTRATFRTLAGDRKRVLVALPRLGASAGLLVVDEAHCI